MLHKLIEITLPPIISICELLGIFIVIVTVSMAFYSYMKGLILRIPSNAKYQLANGLATSLSFKMAAELLKTVIVTSWFEVLILGAVIILRAMMAVMLHFEVKHSFIHLEAAQVKGEVIDETEAVLYTYAEEEDASMVP